MSDGKTIFDGVPDHSPERQLKQRDPSRRLEVSRAGRPNPRSDEDAASPRAAAWTLPSLPAWGSGVLTIPQRPEPEEADSQEIDFVPAQLDDPEPGAPRMPMPYGRESDEAHYATAAALAQFLAQQTGGAPTVKAPVKEADAATSISDPSLRVTRPLDPVPPVTFNDPPSTPSLSISAATVRRTPRGPLGWARRIGVAAAGFGVAVIFAALVRGPASSGESERDTPPVDDAETAPLAVGTPAVEAIPVPVPEVSAEPEPAASASADIVIDESPTDAAAEAPMMDQAADVPASATHDPDKAILAACARKDGLEARKIFRTLQGRSLRASLIRECRKHGVDVSFNGEGHTGPELLVLAKEALKAGKASKAYDLARESSRKDRGTPALQLMGFAACDMGDREKVTYIVNMLRPKDRKAVKARCAKRKR